MTGRRGNSVTVRLMRTTQGAAANGIVAQYKSNGVAFHRSYNGLWPNTTKGIGIVVAAGESG